MQSAMPRSTAKGVGSTTIIDSDTKTAEENIMGKERKSNKEAKKTPGMTPKEKKAAKKAKKNERGRIGE